MEKRLQEHLNEYKNKSFKRIKNLKLEREAINVVAPKTKQEIKEELKEGSAVTIDPSEGNYLYFSRNNVAIYLLRDPNPQISLKVWMSPSKRERTTINNDDQGFIGKEIDMKSADVLINNYLAWVEEEKRKEEEKLLETKRKEQEKLAQEKRKAEEKLKKEKALDDWFAM